VRNRLIQIGLAVLLALVLVEAILLAPGQVRDLKEAATDQSGEARNNDLPLSNAAEEGVDQSMRGMHMIETHDGAKEWELWSDKATSLKAKDMLQLEKVKANFFSESGVTFSVVGKQGTVKVKSKDLRVEGDVVIDSSNGYTFRTAAMDYTSTERALVAPGQVQMNGPKDDLGHSLRLTGIGMRASLKDSKMEVLRDVKAEKALENGRNILIRSQRSTFLGKQHLANFTGQVILDMDSMRITGPEAQFEHDAQSGQIKSVVFSGGAKVSDSDKWATAEKLKVDFATNRFVLRGNPRVVQNNDELRGEEIVLLDGGKRVQVQRVRAKVDQKRMEKNN
jgi:LPS export ABC transporter protein LptC/lipopolysaccharide transport protein LptA